MAKPHKWMEVITAWARGEVIQQRLFDTVRTNEWGAWMTMHPGVAPMRTDMYCEYRVRPAVEPHNWQREKEAFLAGLKVQFRAKDFPVGTFDGAWKDVAQYLVDHCEQTICPDRQEKISLWDRDWLEFRLQPDDRILEGRVLIGPNGNADLLTRHRNPNVRFTFKNGELADTQVLRA